jgi:hypothetical protein
VTRSARAVERLFSWDWDQQGQAALVLDPSTGPDPSILATLSHLRDWRTFQFSPPVFALIAPMVDGGGAIVAAGTEERRTLLIDRLAQAFAETGIAFVA